MYVRTLEHTKGRLMIITVYIAILNLNTTILVYTGKTPIFFPLKILKRFIWNRHAHCNKTNDFLKFSLLLIASQTGLVLHMHIHHCFYLQSSTILNPQNVVWSYCLSHAQGHPVPLPLLPTQVHTTDSFFFLIWDWPVFINWRFGFFIGMHSKF